MVQELKSGGEEGNTALGAFGGLLSFLRSVLLDRCASCLVMTQTLYYLLDYL